MTSSGPTVSEGRAVTDLDRRGRVVLRVMTLAAFIVILNETVMVNAIPVLMEVMDVGARAAQWLSTAFMLTMAVVIPTTGWFLQRVGTRTAFTTAMALFCSGTTLAGLAPTFQLLLAGRVVQAAGTAIMMPLLMTTLLRLVPQEHRGRVMGNVTLTISVAPALGPAVSGLVLQVASWRWLFGLVLPLAITIAFVGRRLLGREPGAGAGDLDGPSVLLTAVGFGGLVYGLSRLGGEGPEGAGIGGVPVVVLLTGLAGLALFVLRQLHLQRAGSPLLDLRVLRHRAFLVATSILSIGFMALMGAIMLLPLLLQQVRGLSTLQTGLLLMPGGLVMGLLGPTVGRLHDRMGARVLAIPGATAVLAGLAAMTWATATAPWWTFLVLHVTVSVGLAFVFTPLFTVGLGSLPAQLYSHGSALLSTAQQVMAAAGTALVITVMSTRAGQLVGQGVAPVPAMAGGIQMALGVATGLGVLVLALTFLVPRHQDHHGGHDATPAGLRRRRRP